MPEATAALTEIRAAPQAQIPRFTPVAPPCRLVSQQALFGAPSVDPAGGAE
jgi:hemin uptake protein HemP